MYDLWVVASEQQVTGFGVAQRGQAKQLYRDRDLNCISSPSDIPFSRLRLCVPLFGRNSNIDCSLNISLLNHHGLKIPSRPSPEHGAQLAC